MSTNQPVVQMIPIDKIHVQNPRTRNKVVFQGIVDNISHVGLKRPITVSRRKGSGDDKEYDLVCGQGRLEACLALGEREVPAVVVDASKEEQLLMSLVENVARRPYYATELIREVRAQKARGCKPEQIGKKLDLDVTYIHGIVRLLEHGEERLIREVENGRVALTVAIRIASSNDEEIQRVLCEAYEDKSLRGQKLATVRRLIEERMTKGKDVKIGGPKKQRARPSKEALLKAYKEETQRQKLMVKKAQLTESRLLVILSALKSLLQDENFITMLRAEGLDNMPKYLAEKIKYGGQK
jgi:ParB family transcriptional regulator, chromosome partitioning protein